MSIHGGITFTPEIVERLRKKYHRAVSMGATQFTFEGFELLTSYAKYLLEYLDMQFGEKNESK